MQTLSDILANKPVVRALINALTTGLITLLSMLAAGLQDGVIPKAVLVAAIIAGLLSLLTSVQQDMKGGGSQPPIANPSTTPGQLVDSRRGELTRLFLIW